MNNKIIADLVAELKSFFNWESQSYEGWESINIYVAEELSDAWLLARPYDIDKFSNIDFKRMVDSANGKWLEKTTETDSYKIILSTKNCNTVQSLTKCLVHEIRHCLDFQNAVKEMSFKDYHSGSSYYNNWSEFRAVYSHTRYEFFSRFKNTMCSNEIFDILAEILGKNSAESTTGIIRSKCNSQNILYYISRYIGASRAIRNLSVEKSINAEVFHLWTMTPQYINENFGIVFYLGNEWDKIEVCDLNAIPTMEYEKLANRIKTKLK